METSDFLNSKWVRLARKKGAELQVRRQFPRWMRHVNNLQLLRRSKQLWKYFRAGDVGKQEKVLIVAALLYLIAPIDLVPDMIPFAGLLDDLGVATMVVNFILKKIDIPTQETDEAQPKRSGRRGKADERL